MAIKFSNLASTTLASGVSSTATSISVTSASLFPTLGSGDYFYASIGIGSGSEVVKVTAVSSTTFTVVRGQDDTTAISHASGVEVALRVTAASLNDLSTQADTESVSRDGDSMTGNLSFGDNNKVILGAGSDLQIYHDGNNSFIDDTGTGSLVLQSNGAFTVIQNSSGVANARFDSAGAASLRYNGAEKLKTTSTGIDVTGNVSLPDNGKAVFGAGSDLQIYHDGLNSYIDDAGTGELLIRGSAVTRIQSYIGEDMIVGVTNGPANLYYDAVKKLATTSTGIDVTGTATMDGLTVDGSASTTGVLTLGSAGVANAFINSADSLYINIDSNNDQSGGNDFQIARNSTGTAGQKIFLAGENGNVQFFEDTGTTPKFHWDAADERLGIGTSNPISMLQLLGSPVATSGALATFRNSDATASNTTFGGILFNSSPGTDFSIGKSNVNSATTLSFRNGNTGASYMDIASDGKVGIGTDDPEAALTVTPESGNFNATYNSYDGVGLFLRGNGTAGNGNYGPALVFGSADSDGTNQENKHSAISMVQTGTDANQAGLAFWVHPTDSSTADLDEAMRITSDGLVGIGTSDPSGKLDVELGLDGVIAEFRGADSDLIQIKGASNTIALDTRNTAALTFEMQGSERMRIDSSGNVGIGAGNSKEAMIQSTNSGRVESNPAYSFNGDLDTGMFNPQTDNTIAFATGGTEAIRIDASQNLLVGRTSPSGVDTDGHVLFANGVSYQSMTDNAAQFLNRNGTGDGPITSFYKNGSTVGSIGTEGGALYISSPYGNDSGLRFVSGIVGPATTTGANRDGAIDLGYDNGRFKDLHLSGFVKLDANKGVQSTGALYLQSNVGTATKSAYLNTGGDLVFGTSTQGVYFGGTSSLNKLDDYEEGTWTPADGSGAGLTFTNVTGTYTKVGRSVTVTGYIEVPTTSNTSAVKISGLPFTSLNTTARSAGGIGYTQSAEAHSAMVEGNATTVAAYQADGSTTKNNHLSAEVLYFGFTYFTS
jgi:hypothetical protein